MKSDTATSWSSSTSSTLSWRARSLDTNGSKATRRIPKARARWATSLPIRPSPTMPSVLSLSSTPVQRDRSHRPPTSAAWAWGMLRAWASSMAMVCSAADSTLDWGALTTITPRVVAEATSTLSSPMPARPTTTRSRPASSTAAVTLVAERMMRAWAPSTASSSSFGRQVEAHVDLVAGRPQAVQAAVGDGFGYQDARHGLILTAPLDPPPTGRGGPGARTGRGGSAARELEGDEEGQQRDRDQHARPPPARG